jgi:3'-5' exoribonuclease
MKSHYVSDLREGNKIEEVFLVTSKTIGNTRAGAHFLKMKLSDKTGTMDAVKWNATQSELSGVSEMDFIHTRGTVGDYNGQMQLTVDSFRKHTGEVDPSDFLATTCRDVDEMFAELRGIVDEVKNPRLSRLLASFFDDEQTSKLFREAPAATKVHHACIGGLLEHTLNVVKSCAALAGIYADADRDLLLTAAALHDIGKIQEYDWSIALKFTEAGHFVGHVVGGAMMVKEAADRIEGFDPLLNLALQHAILAHHGHKEFGSPKQPKSLEAMIVHVADELDADAAMYRNALADSVRDGDLGLFTKRHFFLDRPLFKGIPKSDEPAEPGFDSDLFAAETDYDPFGEE